MTYHIDISRGGPDGFNVEIKINIFCNDENEVAKLLSAIAKLDSDFSFSLKDIAKAVKHKNSIVERVE